MATPYLETSLRWFRALDRAGKNQQKSAPMLALALRLGGNSCVRIRRAKKSCGGLRHWRQSRAELWSLSDLSRAGLFRWAQGIVQRREAESVLARCLNALRVAHGSLQGCGF